MLAFITQQEGEENEESKKLNPTNHSRSSDWFVHLAGCFSWVLYKNKDELQKISNQKHF